MRERYSKKKKIYIYKKEKDRGRFSASWILRRKAEFSTIHSTTMPSQIPLSPESFRGRGKYIS